MARTAAAVALLALSACSSSFDVDATTGDDASPPPDSPSGFDTGIEAPDGGCVGLVCDGVCVDTAHDMRNCGGCRQVCGGHPLTIGESCDIGVCRIVGCVAGHADCDGLAETGCERALFHEMSCGACGVVCPMDAPYCEAAGDSWGCVSRCSPGLALCDWTCVDTRTDLRACGGCDIPCAPGPFETVACEDGMCLRSCVPGSHVCGDACVGDRFPATCGTSCTPCPMPPHSVPRCDDSVCGFDCVGDYHRCGDVCAADTSEDSCGDACSPCPAPDHGLALCDDRACIPQCDAGYVLVAGACVAAPRPVAPLSGARVASFRPTLRWTVPAGVASVRLEVCLDRDCTVPWTAPIDVTGTSFAPSTDLPTGAVFWRLRASDGTGAVSATWEPFVGHGNAAHDASWGSVLDVNGDGHPDVIFDDGFEAHLFSGTAAGIPATESGLVPRPIDWSLTGGETLHVAGDVNGDGYVDLVQTWGWTPGVGVVYLGGAAGPAATPHRIDSLVHAEGVGDVDGDGYADVVDGTWDLGVRVFRGGPGGLEQLASTAFTPPAAAGLWGVAASAAGDVDGDGFADVVVLVRDSLGDSLQWYRGGLASLETTPSVTIALTDVSADGSAGDVNGDGYTDVVAVTGAPPSSLRVWLGGPLGLVTTSTTLPLLDGPTSVTLAHGDVDGDGRDDLAVACQCAWIGSACDSGLVALYTGGDAGPLPTPIYLRNPSHDVGWFASVVGASDDLDGDGFADIVAGPSTGSTGDWTFYEFPGSPAGVSTTTTATWLWAVGRTPPRAIVE